MLFSLLLLPFLRLLPGGPSVLQRRTRALLFRYFRALVAFLSWAGIFRVTLEELPSRDDLDGLLVLPTHPGYLDVVILLGTLPHLTCVVKPSLWTHPLVGGAIRAAGFIPSHDPEGVLDAGAAALRRGEVIILFPEGTRTLPGKPYRFQRGAAHLALRSGARVLPLIVTCDPPLLAKGHRWYQMPADPCDYRIRALAPLDPPRPEPEDLPEPLAARRLTEWLEAQFNKVRPCP